MDADRVAQWAHERAVNTYRAMVAYEQLMKEIVPESQYWCLGRREDSEAVRVNGDIIERAAARAREFERELEQAEVTPNSGY